MSPNDFSSHRLPILDSIWVGRSNFLILSRTFPLSVTKLPWNTVCTRVTFPYLEYFWVFVVLEVDKQWIVENNGSWNLLHLSLRQSKITKANGPEIWNLSSEPLKLILPVKKTQNPWFLFLHLHFCFFPPLLLSKNESLCCLSYREHPNKEHVGLSKENLLLRGCTIRNTEAVVGIVVYAGQWHFSFSLLSPLCFSSS